MEHRLLLHNIRRDSAAAAGTPTATSGDGSSTTRTGDVSTTSNNHIDTNMVIILAVLLCALICALALNSIVRCALRCSTRLATSPPDHHHVTAAIRLSTGGGGRSGGATRGLKKSLVRQIPIAIYTSAADGINIRTTDCIICLGEFVDGEKIRVLPKCNHGFHVPCIDAWLLCHSSCPTCRQSLVVIESSTTTCSSNSE